MCQILMYLWLKKLYTKIYKNKDTCRISQKDQQQALAKRKMQPSNQVRPAEEAKIDLETKGCDSAFNNLGPLSNAMEMAPLTQKHVPTILAMLLKLRRSTLSNLLYTQIKIKSNLNFIHLEIEILYFIHLN